MIITIKKKATKTLLVFALIMGCIFSLMIQPVNAEELKGDEVEGTEYLCNDLISAGFGSFNTVIMKK